MFIKNNKHQKAAKIVYLTLSLLLNATQQVCADLQEVDQEARGTNLKALRIKIAVGDGPYNRSIDTESALSPTTKHALESEPFARVEGWENHANHVASIIHKSNPNAKLRMINVCNTRLEDVLDDAIKSNASFVNLSLTLRNGGISKSIEEAFYRARDKGLGIIMAAGNDHEEIGSTAYTHSLAHLVKKMRGSMILVAATAGADGQEALAGFSNKAGSASKYTVSAPGSEIWAYGDSNRLIKMSGTSMAAPAVTAVASSLMEAYPTLSPTEVLRVIRYSARGTTADQRVTFEKQSYGCGVLDSSAANRMARDIHSLRVTHTH